MEKQEIRWNDWKRIFLGEAPWEFLLEVTGRVIIVYIIFFISMRLLGKRMAAQLTMIELIIIITLGAAIALPMESPDKGILPGVVILTCIVFYEKIISYLSYKSYKLEAITQGEVSILMKDGRILLDEMEHSALSKERLFAELRVEEITHLGQVERVYLEACGIFTVLKYSEENPGLSILPETDVKILKSQHLVEDHYACFNCGNIKVNKDTVKGTCNYCNNDKWVKAIKS